MTSGIKCKKYPGGHAKLKEFWLTLKFHTHKLWKINRAKVKFVPV